MGVVRPRASALVAVGAGTGVGPVDVWGGAIGSG